MIDNYFNYLNLILVLLKKREGERFIDRREFGRASQWTQEKNFLLFYFFFKEEEICILPIQNIFK
jgi:hypothetical protein